MPAFSKQIDRRVSCSVRAPSRTRGALARLPVSVRSNWTGLVVQLDSQSCPTGPTGPLLGPRESRAAWLGRAVIRLSRGSSLDAFFVDASRACLARSARGSRRLPLNPTRSRNVNSENRVCGKRLIASESVRIDDPTTHEPAFRVEAGKTKSCSIGIQINTRNLIINYFKPERQVHSDRIRATGSRPIR